MTPLTPAIRQNEMGPLGSPGRGKDAHLGDLGSALDCAACAARGDLFVAAVSDGLEAEPASGPVGPVGAPRRKDEALTFDHHDIVNEVSLEDLNVRRAAVEITTAALGHTGRASRDIVARNGQKQRR